MFKQQFSVNLVKSNHGILDQNFVLEFKTFKIPVCGDECFYTGKFTACSFLSITLASQVINRVKILRLSQRSKLRSKYSEMHFKGFSTFYLIKTLTRPFNTLQIYLVNASVSLLNIDSFEKTDKTHKLLIIETFIKCKVPRSYFYYLVLFIYFGTSSFQI